MYEKKRTIAILWYQSDASVGGGSVFKFIGGGNHSPLENGVTEKGLVRQGLSCQLQDE